MREAQRRILDASASFPAPGVTNDALRKGGVMSFALGGVRGGVCVTHVRRNTNPLGDVRPASAC